MARKQRKPGWFDQARKGESAFGANVMDPGSNIESEEKIVKSADGTVTKTTVSNKQNTPAFQGMQTEQTQGGVEKETQKSYSPEQISAFDQGNMGAGDEPQAAYSQEQISAFDQSNMGAGDGPQAAYTPEEFEAMRAQAIADSGVETFTRPDGSSAQAIPGSPEAQGLNAMGYAEGGIGAASLLNPGVTGTPVLDTQAQAQEQIIAQQGDQAAQAAFEANSGLGNTAITNQVAADEARVAAEQSGISDFEVANDPTLAQAQVEAQVEVQAKAQAAIDALDEAEANAPDDSGDMGGYDEAQTQAQLDQAIKDTQDRLAAGVDPKSMIDKISEWYGDNPVLAKALIGAVGNYVSTGNMYSALGAGLEGGVGALDSIAAVEAANAKEEKALKTWLWKDNHNHAQALQLQDRKINSATASAAVKAKAESKKAELTYSKNLTARLTQDWDAATVAKFFPAGLQGEVSDALRFVRDNFGEDVGSPSLQLDGAMGVGIRRYRKTLEDNKQLKGKIKLQTYFQDAAIQRRGEENGVDVGLFIGKNGESNPEATIKAYNKIKTKIKASNGDKEKTWRAAQTAFNHYKANDPSYPTMLSNAEDKGVPPFIYFINHEVNLVT